MTKPVIAEFQHATEIATDQAITGSEADVGGDNNILDSEGWDSQTVFLDYTAGDEDYIDIRAYIMPLSTSLDADKYQIGEWLRGIGGTVQTWQVLTWRILAEDADKIPLIFDTSGYKFFKLSVQGSGGSVYGTLTVKITRSTG